MFQSIFLTLQNFMGPTGKQLATPEATPDRRERSFDTQALHVMLQFIRSDELATPPLARYESFGAFVLLVDLLPARSIAVRTASKSEKKPPTSITPGDDSYQGSENTTTRRDAAIMPVPRLLEGHLVVGNLEPLLLAHAAAAPQ